MAPQSIPRRLYQRARSLRATREEARFHPRLRADAGAPELLLSPHWDDAVLDCWSLLASGRALAVVNVCAGIPESGHLTLWDAITGAADSSERARERMAEDGLALARAGREPVNLEILDAQYRRGPDPELAVLDAAISAAAGAAARVYVPAAIGSHPDHRLVRRYGRMLHRAGVPVTLYADVPYCLLHGWPTWVDGRETDPRRNVDAFWLSFLEAVPEMPPLRSAHVERLDDTAAAAKLEAMRAYGTQFPALEYGARGLLCDPEIHRYEVRWELAATA